MTIYLARCYISLLSKKNIRAIKEVKLLESDFNEINESD